MYQLIGSYVSVAIGGAAGAVARFGLTGLLYRSDMSVPLGTLASNVLGCLVMGAVAELIATSTWFTEGGWFPDHYRLLFAVGFCGSFTTLSALVFEMNDMMLRDAWGGAFGYFLLTVAGGFAGFYAGAYIVRIVANAQ